MRTAHASVDQGQESALRCIKVARFAHFGMRLYECSAPRRCNERGSEVGIGIIAGAIYSFRQNNGQSADKVVPHLPCASFQRLACLCRLNKGLGIRKQWEGRFTLVGHAMGKLAKGPDW
ncbi:hypothetical protein C8J46_11018 [Sphingomonas sp. PP-F2F-A104-K0414]|nr:hypothetical protein C8J46_11018 [Sphingomonas sp. PP-F2F-A104-K0414]